jgi:hypothetical protein
MPDTAPHPDAYPQPSAQKAGCGFPMLKVVVALFSLARGGLLRAVHGPVRGSEGQLFRQLWTPLSQGEGLLADRGFCSFGCLAALQPLGLGSVMRLHPARRLDWRRGQRLSKADRLLEWAKPRCRPRLLSAEEFAALPATLQVRHVRLQARLKGCRTRSLGLVTTLLEPVASPVEALAALYL